jgi:predicted house-cleaning noncanonical NTP pyrophosphatase (MazG superfamily)
VKYDKLVRDKIPKILADSGIKATFRVLAPTEHTEYLEKKLDEEVAEFHESKDIEELADILEVVIALAVEKGYGVDNLWAERLKKKTNRGGFDEKILLLEVCENETPRDS